MYNAPKIRTSIFHPTWIYTPLIEHITKMRGWKEPTLKAEDVANSIVARILSGRGKQECLPSDYSPVSLIKGFPTWMQEIARNKGGDMAKALQDEGGFVVPERKED